MDDVASRTDESARDPTSPSSTTLDFSFQRPDNPAILQWRSAVEPPNVTTKLSPTVASAPHSSSFRRSAVPQDDSSHSGDTPGSSGRNLPVHAVESGFPRLGASLSSKDVRRRGSQGWQASAATDSSPSLTREDTTKTAQSSEPDSGADHWPRLANSPPSLDHQKLPFAGGRILPVPPGFVQAGAGPSRAQTTAAHQPQRPGSHTPATRPSSIHNFDYPRTEDEHSNPLITPTRDGFHSRMHSRDVSVSQDSRRWSLEGSHNGEDQQYQQQKARAAMGFATLLRASEHLEDKPNQFSDGDNSGYKRK